MLEQEKPHLYRDKGETPSLQQLLLRPRTRPGPEAEPDPRTRTSFTIYTFSNTIEINVAQSFQLKGPTVLSINIFIQYGLYAISELSFTKHYQSLSPQINQICSSHENL